MFDSRKEAEVEHQRIMKAAKLAVAERSVTQNKLVLKDQFEYKKKKTETMVQQRFLKMGAETARQKANVEAKEKL